MLSRILTIRTLIVLACVVFLPTTTLSAHARTGDAVAAAPITPALTAIKTPAAPPASAAQVITVTAPRGSTHATLTAWQRRDNGSWFVRFRMPARVGQAGIGPAKEGSKYTPEGDMTLGVAFGRAANPGTSMSYFQTDRRDWWNGNPESPQYNLHVRQSSSPGGFSENLYTAGVAYDYAINMNYNVKRIPWGGSAFFLHVDTGSPTAGCVAVSRDSMVRLLRWLKPKHRPVIDIRANKAWTPSRGASTNTLFTAGHRITAGDSTSLVGQLKSYFGTPIANASVRVITRVQGTSTWKLFATLRTDTSGRYSLRLRPAASRDYVVQYLGSTWFLRSSSRQIGIVVR